MDWSKAKNIIIAALLVVNLTIGGLLLSQSAAQRQQMRQAAADTKVFLEKQGMQVNAAVPEKAEKMPVLFVQLQRASSQEGAPQSYKGYPILVEGSAVDFEVSGSGQQAARTITASEALLKLYARLSREGSVAGKSIDQVELVYLLTADRTSSAAQDTAIPAWRIEVSGKTYTVNAYEE